MTYRNDHEAALARIDALEHELTELRAAPAPAEPVEHRAPRPRDRTAVVLTACTVGLFAGIVGGVMLGLGGESPREPRPHTVVKHDSSAPVRRDFILWCADAIRQGPIRSTQLTDPHGTHALRIEPTGHTGVACRDEVNQYVTSPELTANEREALWQWAVHEDELAGASSRIEVYYANDPAKLDGYATAPQLWLEYDRAYYGRNRAVDSWRENYTR